MNLTWVVASHTDLCRETIDEGPVSTPQTSNCTVMFTQPTKHASPGLVKFSIPAFFSMIFAHLQSCGSCCIAKYILTPEWHEVPRPTYVSGVGNDDNLLAQNKSYGRAFEEQHGNKIYAISYSAISCNIHRFGGGGGISHSTMVWHSHLSNDTFSRMNNDLE